MGRLTHAGHTLTWEEHSRGAHSFIFVNGYSANQTIWRREVALLAPHGRCVTLDLPGHYPARAPRGYSRLTQGELLDLETRAVAAIVGDGSCTLIGHSTGGLVALGVAARLPERVRRVVTLGCVVWGPLTGALGLFQRAMGRPGAYQLYCLNYLLTRLSAPVMRRAIGLAYIGDPRLYWRSPVVAPAIRGWLPMYRRSSLRGFYVLLRMLADCDVRREARRVSCPLLAIYGERDPVVPPESSRWLAAQLPAATALAVPGAGHLPHWEAPEMVDAALMGWLAATPPAPAP